MEITEVISMEIPEIPMQGYRKSSYHLYLPQYINPVLMRILINLFDINYTKIYFR